MVRTGWFARAPSAALAALIAFAGIGGACAEDCAGEGVTIVIPGGFYVWIDDEGSAFAFQESNGQDGLQQGGTTLLGDPVHCQNFENPDLALAGTQHLLDKPGDVLGTTSPE